MDPTFPYAHELWKGKGKKKNRAAKKAIWHRILVTYGSLLMDRYLWRPKLRHSLRSVSLPFPSSSFIYLRGAPRPTNLTFKPPLIVSLVRHCEVPVGLSFFTNDKLSCRETGTLALREAFGRARELPCTARLHASDSCMIDVQPMHAMTHRV